MPQPPQQGFRILKKKEPEAIKAGMKVPQLGPGVKALVEGPESIRSSPTEADVFLKYKYNLIFDTRSSVVIT